MNTLETIKRNATGRNLIGSTLLYLGVIFFLRNMGVYIPEWFTGFSLILLVAGLFHGIRHDFVKPAAIYMIIFGFFFLVEDIMEELGSNADFPFFPIVFIAIGVHVMRGSRRSVRTSVA